LFFAGAEDPRCLLGLAGERVTRRRLAPMLPASWKALVQFVADIHQPLHPGFADDKAYQIQAFGSEAYLHAVWDTGPSPRSRSLDASAQRLAPSSAVAVSSGG
jgi:hypothetical protein